MTDNKIESNSTGKAPVHTLIFPDYFEDEGWIYESKGYFADITLHFADKIYELMFYDPVRLSQEINGELQRQIFFLERNLIVIPAVTRQHMEQAVAQLIAHRRITELLPMPPQA